MGSFDERMSRSITVLITSIILGCISFLLGGCPILLFMWLYGCYRNTMYITFFVIIITLIYEMTKHYNKQMKVFDNMTLELDKLANLVDSM